MSLESTIQTRIGSILPNGRICAIFAPSVTVKPFVVWQVISATAEDTHDGACDFYRSRVQVSCYADSSAAARTLRGQVIAAMEIDTTTVENKSESYEEDALVYRADADFFVWANN